MNAAPYAAPVVFAVAAFGPFNLAESTIRLLGPGAAPVVLSGIANGYSRIAAPISGAHDDVRGWLLQLAARACTRHGLNAWWS